MHPPRRCSSIPVLRLAAALLLFFPATCVLPLGPALPTPAQALVIQAGIDEITANNAIPAVLAALCDPALGSRYPADPDCIQYQARIINFLTASGYAPFTQAAACPDPKFAALPQTMNNIIAVQTGTEPGRAPVLVTAHWDTVPGTLGADDNASGCAGVIEIARTVFARSLQFRRTVIFVLFGLEEENLSGSEHYASTMAQAPAAVFNLDLIGFTSAREITVPLGDVLLGFPATGDFIGVLASRPTERTGLTFIAAADRFVPELTYYFALCDGNISNNPVLTLLMRSDHASFWKRDIPALMISDTAEFREGSPYHTAEDTVDTLDPSFMLAVIKATFASLCIEAELIAP